MIDKYLTQQATIKRLTTRDVYGNEITDNGTDVVCRFVAMTDTIKDAKGQDVQQDAEMWVLPDTAIASEDIVEHDGTTYKVIKVEKRVDFDGTVNHIKAKLTRKK